jgi:hypothetical protein
MLLERNPKNASRTAYKKYIGGVWKNDNKIKLKGLSQSLSRD